MSPITVALVHRLHQTRISRLIRRLPFIGKLAHLWWMREQFMLAKQALENLPAANRRLSQVDQARWVPRPAEISSLHEGVMHLGNEFSKAMKQFETHKFHQLGYEYVYGSLLRAFENKRVRLLEVGIGTTDANFPSSMSDSYRPGTSLRAWNHYFSSAEIHGADIDRSLCVITESYIGHWVDQRSEQSLKGLCESLGNIVFDLIIDDGLHTCEANAKTMAFLLPLLSDEGFYVVEDILVTYDQAWLSLCVDLEQKGYGAVFFSGQVLDRVSKIHPTEGLLVVYRK